MRPLAGAAGATARDLHRSIHARCFDRPRLCEVDRISFDDPDSLRKKRGSIAKKKRRGAMIWDLSSDTGDSRLSNALIAP